MYIILILIFINYIENIQLILNINFIKISENLKD